VKILPVTGKKRINFGSDLDASAMSEPPNTARAWLPGYYRGLRERYMRKVAVIFFCHSPKIAQKVGYGTPLLQKVGGTRTPVPSVSQAYGSAHIGPCGFRRSAHNVLLSGQNN